MLAFGAASPEQIEPIAGAEQDARRETLVVVGNGMVGHRFCERFAATPRGSRTRIVVFAEERRPAYDRVRLTDLFSGATARSLSLGSEESYAARGIELHLGDPVVAIDRPARSVRCESGVRVRYDRLVLATGSEPFVPPIPGRDLPGVFVYRTIDDVEAIRRHARGRRSAAVMGGGLLGLEAARALHDCGLETQILEVAAGLLCRQLDASASARLAGEVEKLGIRVRVATSIVSIRAIEGGLRLESGDGGVTDVEMLVLAAGIRPRDQIARGAGLDVDARGGVVVDDGLATNDPRIHAIGECASHRGCTYGLVAPGYRMADVLAERLAGRRSRFKAPGPSVRLKVLGVEVAAFGDNLEPGELLTSIRDDRFLQLVLRRRRIVGATVIGPFSELGRLEADVAAGRRLARRELRRLEQEGTLWSEPASISIARWPAEAIVCSCTGTTRADLGAASPGCATVAELSARTGAGTVCGSCVPLLAELIGAEDAPAAVRFQRGLLAVSAFAIVLVAAVVLSPPVPYATSVLVPSVDVLWRSPVVKQATGFALLALGLASLPLSARKRATRLRGVGDYATWRLAHAALGVACVALLVAHTGMRIGHNLNRALMLCTLGLLGLGALAGVLTAVESRIDPKHAKRLRHGSVTAHLLLGWPMPVLVLLHVVAAYYF